MRRHVQLLQQCGNARSAAMVGIQSAAADLAVTPRQDMLREAAQELSSFQRHPFGFATIGVVFIVEADPIISVDLLDAPVGDGHLMRVTPLKVPRFSNRL